MAVNMNERERVRLFCMVIFVFCLTFKCALTSTTQPPTAVVNTTTTTTTTTTPTTTTTTTTATTTTVPPLQSPPTIYASEELLRACPCDLTGNACDVNCCCDPDCNADDRMTFSQCLPFSTNADNRLCVRDEIIAFENSGPVISEITDSDLFCIFLDNKEERNYYSTPASVTSLASLDQYRREFPSFSFQATPTSLVNFNSPFYMAGDPVYAVWESGFIGVLSLPQTLTSTECLDRNPAAYLTDQSGSCVRDGNLTDCQAGTQGLDLASFIQGFRVVTSPRLFQELNTSVPGSNNFYSLYNNSLTLPVELDFTTAVSPVLCLDQASGLTGPCPFPTSPLPTPTPGANTCERVVKQVNYRLVTDGTTGIVRVLARAVLTTVQMTSTFHLTQTFSTAFQPVGSGETFERSGNPGYVWGQPLIAGVLNQTSDAVPITYQILLGSSRSSYMTVVRASASGDCFSDADSRTPVLFGQNVRTGCLLRVSAANLTEYCRLMQLKIIQVLEFDSVPEINGDFLDTNRYVAVYGNSDISKTGDWVKVLHENRLLPSAALGKSSCQLSLSMHIQVLYASVGALVNPQHRVLSVSYLYHAPTTVLVRPTMGGQYNQPVEISSSVGFADVSEPAVAAQGEAPIFLTKLPYDFFYPFISDAHAPRSVIVSALLPVILVVARFWS